MTERGDSWFRSWFTVGWLVLALAPTASAVATIRSDWAPLSDEALIAAMTVDSVSMDPPLVGMPTSLGFEGGEPLSHAGPLGFWLLALPTKVLGEPGHGLIVGSLILALGGIAGIAVLLRRRSDVALEGAALVLIAAMVATIGGAILSNPWNPYIGVLPLLLALLATCFVLAGHHRHLWVLILAGSLAAQAYLGYAPLVGSLVFVALAGITFDLARTSRSDPRRPARDVVPVGLLLGALAWIGPVLDQLFGTQNLERLWRSQSGDRPTAGLDHGVDVAVEMTSVPPRWILGRARDQALTDPTALRVAVSLAMIAYVAGLAVWALRRRDRTLASLAAVSFTSIVVATGSSARVVNLDSILFQSERALVFRLLWWPVGVLFALTVIVGTVHLVASLRRTEDVHDRRWSMWLAPGVGLLCAILVPLGYRAPAEDKGDFYRRDLEHAAAVARLPGSSVVLRFWPEGSDRPEGEVPEFGYSTGLIAQLRLRGIAVRFPPDPHDAEAGTFVLAYRDEHRAEAADDAVVLLYRVGPEVYLDPPDGYELLSLTGPGPGESFTPFDVPSAVYVRSG